MLSKGIVIPLSFASLPVISITFFDKKKRSRRREEEDEVDVPPDGLSLEDLENMDLDELESRSSKLSEQSERDDPGVITILPGWSFIPSITIALPRKKKDTGPRFAQAEDAEIIEGIREAPLPDTLFSPPWENDRMKDRDVAEFDPETDAVIRPDADTESIITPKAIPPLAAVGNEGPRPVRSLPLDELDLDLDLDEEIPDALPLGGGANTGRSSHHPGAT